MQVPLVRRNPSRGRKCFVNLANTPLAKKPVPLLFGVFVFGKDHEPLRVAVEPLNGMDGKTCSQPFLNAPGHAIDVGKGRRRGVDARRLIGNHHVFVLPNHAPGIEGKFFNGEFGPKHFYSDTGRKRSLVPPADLVDVDTAPLDSLLGFTGFDYLCQMATGRRGQR